MCQLPALSRQRLFSRWQDPITLASQAEVDSNSSRFLINEFPQSFHKRTDAQIGDLDDGFRAIWLLAWLGKHGKGIYLEVYHTIPIHTQKNGHFNIFEQGKLTIQWIRGAKIWRHGRPEEHERKPDGGMMKRSLAPQVMSFHPYSTHMKKKSAGWEDSYNHIDDLWSLFNMGLFRILRAYYDYHWFNIYYSRSVNDSSMFKTQVLSKIEAWLAADLALQRWPWPWFFPNWGVVSQPNLQKAGLNRPLSIDRIKGAFHRVSMTGMCMELFDSMGRLWPCWSVSLGAEMHRDATDMIIMISQE